jgi:outer membrane receptor protein involved in Fe transport
MPHVWIVRTALMFLLLASVAGARPLIEGITGVVRDGTGGVVVGAGVSLLTADQAIVGATRTDKSGRFTFADVRPGRYLLIVLAPGFAETRLSVAPGDGGTEGLAVTISPEGLRESVSVTATRGVVQDSSVSAQAVTVIGASDIGTRAKEVVAQAVAEESGVHLLRTSPTMAGIYVRGLTGNKVTVFVDGVRYSTASARGGVSTFLDLVEPTGLQAVEVLRGPNSAQYGSDAIGGSVQFLSQVPSFADGVGGGWDGLFSTGGGTADWNAGTNLSAGYRGGNFGFYGHVAARRIDDLRPGGGLDSHAAVTRFLGLPSNRLMPAHLPDTGFTQYGGQLRFHWAPTANQQVMVYYNRSQQDDGNLIADLRNLMLDFFYVKYQRVGLGWFDQLTATYSYNSQREERVNQGGNGNPNASITHEYERTNVNGFQAQLTKRLGSRQNLLVGGEFYPERVHAPSYSYNPVTGVSAVRRGRVPDNASYRSGGGYVQDVIEALPGRLQVVLNARYSGASYESLAADSPLVNGQRLWPDDSLTVSNATFRAGVVATPGVRGLSFTGSIGSGFRAPHITDLGTVGLTGSGFQVSASGVAGLNATVGSSASASATSTGQPVEQVTPETSVSYEAGVHFRAKKVSTDFYAFVNNVYDNITYQALILPQGAVGLTLGDQAIASQNANGVVYVAASSSPVLVRTNFGDARIYGFEHTLDWTVARGWSLRTAFTYLHAADTSTGAPPNIEGGTPAPDGYVKLRYMTPAGRWWAESYLHLAARQDRLSTLDLEDRRTGATRTRSNIRNFFYNGATARGWVGPGADGVAGSADDILIATGETLAQVQGRVLGALDSAPLFTDVPGYVTVGFRGGIRIGSRHELTVDFENVGDVNYRGIAWGIDAPGRNFSVGWRMSF